MMKKVLISVLPIMLLFCFCGCSGNQTAKMEDYDWTMVTVQSIAENGRVIAYNPEETLEDEIIYTEAKKMEITLTAQNGKITLSDKTDDKDYEGTYKLKTAEYDTAIYEVNVNGNTGNAVVSWFISSTGNRSVTLILSLGDYAINFRAQI